MNYLKLAQECQLIGMRPHLDGIYQEALEKFASLVEEAVRADEREECAKMCEARLKKWEKSIGKDKMYKWMAPLPEAIRARGTT